MDTFSRETQQQQQDDNELQNEILYTQMLNQQDDSLVENSAYRLELLRSESQNVAVDVAGCQRQQMQKQTSSSSENAGLMNEDKEQLINYIQSYPALWDTSLRSYKDLNKKDAAWKQISKNVKLSSKCIFFAVQSVSVVCVVVC